MQLDFVRLPETLDVAMQGGSPDLPRHVKRVQQMQLLMLEEAQRDLQRVGRRLREVCCDEDMTVRCARTVSYYEDRNRQSAQQALDGATENDRPAGKESFTCNAGNDEVYTLG